MENKGQNMNKPVQKAQSQKSQTQPDLNKTARVYNAGELSQTGAHESTEKRKLQ